MNDSWFKAISWVPWQLRNAARELLESPKRIALRRELEQRSFELPSSGIAIHVGGVLNQGLIAGGKVKLLHLVERFPESAARFNILYLVSSAIPPFAEELVHWAKRHGAKFVWNQNGVGYPAWAGADYEQINARMKCLIHQADYVIYQSEFCRRSANRYLGAPLCESSVLFNPVDLEKFSPGDALDGEPLRLLAIGTHTYPERVISVIETLKQLRVSGVNAVLTIAGRLDWPDGELQIADLLWKRQLGRYIELCPEFSQDEAVEFYRKHHILLHPKYMDPCPTVVIEALACGLPVVGSASGGLPEMVDEKTGILIPVKEDWEALETPSAQAMAEAVMVIRPHLETYRHQARLYAERCFDQKQWVDRHEKIFREVLGQ